MGKDKKEQKKTNSLLTTAESDAHKQILKREGKVLLAKSKDQLNSIMKSNPDANYISIFKKDYRPVKDKHPLDEMQDHHYIYDPKAKRDRHFYIKNQDQTKNCFKIPMTSNQEYGWKQPIDTFPSKYGYKQHYDESLMKNKQKR